MLLHTFTQHQQRVAQANLPAWLCMNKTYIVEKLPDSAAQQARYSKLADSVFLWDNSAALLSDL